MHCDPEVPLALTGAPTGVLALVGTALLVAGLLARRTARTRPAGLAAALLALAIAVGATAEPAAAQGPCSDQLPQAGDRRPPVTGPQPDPTPSTSGPTTTSTAPAPTSSTSTTSSTTTTSTSTTSTTTTVFAPVY